jgi:hypothetical protein
LNSFCKFCKHKLSDLEIGIDLNDMHAAPIPRKWLICELDKEQFPWGDDCEDYESTSPGDDSNFVLGVISYWIGCILGLALLIGFGG